MPTWLTLTDDEYLNMDQVVRIEVSIDKAQVTTVFPWSGQGNMLSYTGEKALALLHYLEGWAEVWRVPTPAPFAPDAVP